MSDKRQYDDDDGRVIADMGDVSRQSILVPDFSRNRKRRDFGPEEEQQASHPQDQIYLDRDEKRAMISGAVAAGLVVALALAAGFAALILLINAVWG